VNVHKQRKASAVFLRLRGTLGFLTLAAILTACATHQEAIGPLAPISFQNLQYYPYQVKGYQGLYPKRRVIVLPVVDSRDFKEAAGAPHSPEDGHPAIGVVSTADNKVAERLYGPPLGPLFQQAIAQASDEAGMPASTSAAPIRTALLARDADYLISSKIVRCWITKTRVGENRGGAVWRSAATVALDILIYKPPFDVPFWEGQSVSVYDDPPLPSAGLPPDTIAIYDQPGEVLSAALTRAVAGIFRRDDLHALVQQDTIRTPH
jgi:hypothetical protein